MGSAPAEVACTLHRPAFRWDYDWGYGYQWWIFNHAGKGKPEMYGGWGWGGQFPLIIPELGLIAVLTGWNIYEE